MWKQNFRARPPSAIESWSGENDAWTVSSTAWPIREWSEDTRDCLAPVRRTSFPSHLPGHVFPAKHSMSCIRYLNAFRARLPSNSDSWRCENEAIRSVHARLSKIENNENGRYENEAFVRDLSQKSESWRCENGALVRDFLLLCDFFAVRSLCCGISLLWHPFASTFLCFDSPLLWHPFALTSLCFASLWHCFALTSLRYPALLFFQNPLHGSIGF